MCVTSKGQDVWRIKDRMCDNKVEARDTLVCFMVHCETLTHTEGGPIAFICRWCKHSSWNLLHSPTQGWPGPYIYTVYDRNFGDSCAKNILYTPWFWPTLVIHGGYVRFWPTLRNYEDVSWKRKRYSREKSVTTMKIPVTSQYYDDERVFCKNYVRQKRTWPCLFGAVPFVYQQFYGLGCLYWRQWFTRLPLLFAYT